MRYMLFFLPLAVLFNVGHTLATAAEEPKPATSDGTIKQVLDALARYNTIDLQATSTTTLQRKSPGNTVSKLTFEVKRSGPRSLVSIKEVVQRPGQPVWQGQSEAILSADGDVSFRQCTLDEALHQIVGGDSNLGMTLYSERLSGESVATNEKLYNQLNDSGAALWIVGYDPLASYLSDASSTSVTADGKSMKIEARSPFGKLTMVTSKENGWLPASFEITKGPGDLLMGGTVKSLYQSAITSIVWTGTASDFKQNSTGQLAPTAITITRTTNRKEKPSEVSPTEIEIKELDFSPRLTAADFQPTIKIPQGYPVVISGATQQPYQWDGSKIVQATKPSPYNFGLTGEQPPAETAEAIPPEIKGEGSKWLIIGGCILLAAILIPLVWFRNRSSRT
ncbi:hypothetical protein Pan153_19500 [Gimesia panareensis]|uniref:Uncharacterized protein n=1 Tax=Gimesia panareensis TaxID=2527978 RepID=A0A518FM11_9PLAN|nr:hypothetical protein [Gimesia panareensis]QDV17315.1 hypothetical protein Pan153_19500 [Gimesia panareensis]